MLEKKLKIPSTQVIQTSELPEFEKEKEALNTELTYCKSKLLKFAEKENKWEKDANILVENEKDLKAKMATKEKELQEKYERIKISLLFFL